MKYEHGFVSLWLCDYVMSSNWIRENKVWREGTSNYILQYLWDVITWQCPWHMLLTQYFWIDPCFWGLFYLYWVSQRHTDPEGCESNRLVETPKKSRQSLHRVHIFRMYFTWQHCTFGKNNIRVTCVTPTLKIGWIRMRNDIITFCFETPICAVLRFKPFRLKRASWVVNIFND